MPNELKPYQTLIEPDQLYRTNAAPRNNISEANKISEQLNCSIQSSGGSAVDVYGSQILPTDDTIGGMGKMIDDLSGIAVLTLVPNFMYVDTPGDTLPGALVLSGVNAYPVMLGAAESYSETFTEADGSLVPVQEGSAESYSETFTEALGEL